MKITNGIFSIILLLTTICVRAQHEPQSWIFGAQLNTQLSELEHLGGAVQVNYAYNCYTTFVGEVSTFNYNSMLAYEVGGSVNLILNNFKKYNYILTGGIGLTTTSLKLTKEEIDKAIFIFSNEDLHLSLLLKLRGLYKITNTWHFVSEINFKTIGAQFANFSVGFNYELPL